MGGKESVMKSTSRMTKALLGRLVLLLLFALVGPGDGTDLDAA
jgi:hypothetical protein